MPVLSFKGKTAVETYHWTVPHHILEFAPKLSVLPKGDKPGLDGNLIIEGDNLLALKALLPTHAGLIKCIYVDPPYNTGDEGWVFNDNLTQPQFKEWIGQVVGKEGEDFTRHDKWCCMMYPGNPDRVWRFEPETMKEVIRKKLVIWPDDSPERKLKRPRYKTYYDPSKPKMDPVSSWIESGTGLSRSTESESELDDEDDNGEESRVILHSNLNVEGGRILRRIFGKKVMSYPNRSRSGGAYRREPTRRRPGAQRARQAASDRKAGRAGGRHRHQVFL
jgi:hypothetical protein